VARWRKVSLTLVGYQQTWSSGLGKKTPADYVRKWTKAGKVKKKCCRSKSRCKKCPVLALKRAKVKVAAKKAA
jgi:hypothetical protein